MVTLARSVAHLSSEMRNLQVVIQEVEQLRMEMQQVGTGTEFKFYIEYLFKRTWSTTRLFLTQVIFLVVVMLCFHNGFHLWYRVAQLDFTPNLSI